MDWRIYMILSRLLSDLCLNTWCRQMKVEATFQFNSTSQVKLVSVLKQTFAVPAGIEYFGINNFIDHVIQRECGVSWPLKHLCFLVFHWHLPRQSDGCALSAADGNCSWTTTIKPNQRTGTDGIRIISATGSHIIQKWAGMRSMQKTG